MGKVLYTYGEYTDAQLKARASIPSQSDISLGGNCIVCYSVDIPTEIRDIIGEGSNDLGTIYSSAKVNKWSHFGVWLHSWIGDTIIHTLKSNPFDMSNFCGYNHNAKPPVYYFTALPASIDVEMFDTLNLAVSLARGEGIPVNPAASKDAVDIQTVIGAGLSAITTHNRIAVPVAPSVVSKTVSITPEYNMTWHIRPTYYRYIAQEYEDLNLIEDGLRDIAINVILPLFTATIVDLPDKTGGSPLSVSTPWSITRTGTAAKSVYGRIRITGTGITTLNYNLGLLSFTGSEVKSGHPLGMTITSETNTTTTVLIQLQISNTYEFTNLFTLAESAFTWTTPGLIQ